LNLLGKKCYHSNKVAEERESEPAAAMINILLQVKRLPESDVKTERPGQRWSKILNNLSLVQDPAMPVAGSIF
jgi:hypothetical protein